MGLEVKDENLGSDSAPVIPPDVSSDSTPPPQTVSLTPDLKSSLGLVDCKPGDTYTIKLQAAEGGEGDVQNFDVISSVPDSDGLPDAPADDGGAEEKILGYKRPKIASAKETPSTDAEHLLD